MLRIDLPSTLMQFSLPVSLPFPLPLLLAGCVAAGNCLRILLLGSPAGWRHRPVPTCQRGGHAANLPAQFAKQYAK
jgi:hypothetical protein